MPEYLAPGVFVEEVSFRSKSIEGVGTSVAGIVGPTRTGPLRGRPELVSSFADFVRTYGDASDLNLSGNTGINHTAIAAKAFFDGGGTKLYVSRVVAGVNASSASGVGSSASFASASDTNGHVTFDSRFAGEAGNATLEIKWHDSENLLKFESISAPPEGEIVFLEASGLTTDVRAPDTDATEPNGLPNTRFPLNISALVRRSGDHFEIVDNRCEVQSQDGEPVDGEHFISASGPVNNGILLSAGLINDASTSVSFTRAYVKTPTNGSLQSGTSAVLRFSEETNLAAYTDGDHWGTATTLTGVLNETGANTGVYNFVVTASDMNPSVVGTVTMALPALAASASSAAGIVVQRNFDIDVHLGDADGEIIYSYSNISTAPSGDDSLASVLSAEPQKRADQLNSPVSCTLDNSADGGEIMAALNELFDDDALAPTPPSVAGSRYLISLTGGTDGDTPVAADYGGETDEVNGNTGLAALEDIDDIAIVLTPAAAADSTSHAAVVVELQKHCLKMRYRIGLVDSREGMSLSEVRDFASNFDDSRLALYYPWVMTSDPVGARDSIACPPSGFIAGVYANTDVQRGVHKPPANEVVVGALGFAQDVNRFQQEILNPNGINCLRSFPGRGHRVWGGRTLSSDPEWKYVNVRRYFLYLERSIEKSTQWIVFEPNGERLWSNVRSTVEDFLYNEWYGGKLLGPTPKHAYFVRCDRSTMTQNDLDNGRLVCEIGVAALKPAEFVIFRIGQKTSDA